MPLKTMMDEQPSLNLTPMLDIVFLLIIFFMVGSRFSELSDAEQRLDIEVPQVGTAAAATPAPAPRVIHIDRDGAIEFGGDRLTVEQLTEALRAARSEYPRLSVVVRGDGRTDLQNAAAVYSACLEAGVTDIGLAVRSSSERR